VNENVLVYGNVKTHGGGSKRIHHNLIVSPDAPVDGHGCFTAQSSFTNDVFFFENTCLLQEDPRKPRLDQRGQNVAALYDFNAHCAHKNASDWEGWATEAAHGNKNVYGVPGGAASRVFAFVSANGHAPANGQNCTLAFLQASGREVGSTAVAWPSEAEIVAKAKALLGMK